PSTDQSRSTSQERNPTGMRDESSASPSTDQSRSTSQERNPTSMRDESSASPSTYQSRSTSQERNPTGMRGEVTPNPSGKSSIGGNGNRGGKQSGLGDTSVVAVGLGSLAVLVVAAAVVMTPL
ncbi:hypothetical protein TraAM80_10213, partial [Trypanosoma rangeli]